ncbi:hypothetical protein D9619_003803 [Psilocybe cf. subviscida]|uniref:MYND-type domain-containing protein n=1 Tax=Psilocybe cf. subviscida TaxID=2480587 RepID=A0A8H5AY37_9AGAR|nr:hypothetical protein D9619_003803 [Psilocybe cf. subviscida]
MFDIAVEVHPRGDPHGCDDDILRNRNILPSPTKTSLLDPSLRKMELYTQMYHVCFLSATTDTLSPRTGTLKNRRLSVAECVRKRYLLKVPKAVLLRQVDAEKVEYMLEYGLRGVDETIPMSHCSAYTTFLHAQNIASRKRDQELNTYSIAACCCLYMDMHQLVLGFNTPVSPEKYKFLLGCIYNASLNGRFTPACIWFWTWASTQIHDNPQLPPIDYTLKSMFDNEMDIYQEETGLQPLKATYCVVCSITGARKLTDIDATDVLLKQCAGSCRRDKKPVYCGSQCQASDWETHKRWCTEKRMKLVEEEEYF